MTINDHGKHRTVDEMVDQRIGDYEAFQEYMRAVFDAHRGLARRRSTPPSSPVS